MHRLYAHLPSIEEARLKLEKLKVVDLSSFLPGPNLTMSLADHRAKIVKVEGPGGNRPRKIGKSDGDHSVFLRNVSSRPARGDEQDSSRQ